MSDNISVEEVGNVAKKGSTLIATRTNERAVALNTYASDPKYKKYVQQVEKCLNSFDIVHEWADCIAFLKQLLKTFQSYMQFKEIPRKLIVSKRLFQCLNPALPTGVHQRALEVYIHILAVLGMDGLKRDLSLWSSGLFPFFEYAATSVKPTLLNIYDTHYLPLQACLRPITKSFILALLPGLEEETGEFFDKVLGLLDRLLDAISMSFFFQNIWLVMLTTPSARGTSLSFLARRLPRLNVDEDISNTVGKDIGLMIRAFAAALEDENLLVRRAALDVLLQTMRVDSTAIRKAQKDDRAILMRAATGVVLRRDLSLNRRLYTWLLGPDEKSDNQIAYLKENTLEFLSSTLKSEMISPSGEYAESRPFKIFISLLDKWEIGAPLTEALVYDAFKAVMDLMENPTEGGEDLTMTASTLYEAIEPQLLWKHFLSVVFDEILEGGTRFEAIRLVRFLVISFPHDEEVQTIYFPIMFTAITDLVNAQIRANSRQASYQYIRETTILLETIFQHMHHASLLYRPKIIAEAESGYRAYEFACTLFKITPKLQISYTTSQSLSIPFASCFYHLISLSTTFAHILSQDPRDTDIPVLREVLSRILNLLDRLTGGLSSQIVLTWDTRKWLDVMLSCLEYETATFLTADRLISLAIALHCNQFLEPRFTIDERPILDKMVNRLLGYLQPTYSAYHVRAVNLIWSLESSTTHSHVESILAQCMTSPKPSIFLAGYEAFGVLWRLTEDNLLPGFRFKVPMMFVLDTLKSNNLTLRRLGETWMRCCLKSYIRILDPIFYDMLDPSVLHTPTIFKTRGREISGFFYERPFDQRLINHLLEILLSIVTFGGQGFVKATRASALKRSFHQGLVQRVNNSGLVDVDASYLHILVNILLRIVQSEPREGWSPSMQPLNTVMQSNAIELLQLIVSQDEIETPSVESIEATTIGKLYLSIHMSRLDLQNKWLHLLHSLISASMSKLEFTRQAVSGKQDDLMIEASATPDKGPDLSHHYAMNPLLIQTLIDGLSVRSNRPVLQHWLDFVLMAVPQFQPALHAVVAPLNDCLCHQVLFALRDVLRMTSQSQSYVEDLVTTVTDADFTMLLHGLERLILLSLAYTSELYVSEDDPNALEKSASEVGGLLNYVSNVFSSESSAANPQEQLTARSPGYRALDEGIRVLYSVWASLIWKSPQLWSPKDESLSLIYNRTRTKCRRVLEHLFRVQSTEVFESVIDWWNRETTLSASSPDAVFELLDVLVANAQNAVHMICESILPRVLGSPEKSKKQALNLDLTDAILFKFLEQYFRRLEGPLAIQVWSRYMQLVKDIIGTSRDFKPSHFPALRCLGVLAEKTTQSIAMEDRKLRKELQDYYGKLLDSCVVYVGRSTDQGSWIRRGIKDPIISNGRESPGLRTETKVDDKSETTAMIMPPETSKMGSEVIAQINSFVATSALPNLRKLLMENDKIINACNNIVYYIVNPALRGKTRPMDIDTAVIAILQGMTRIPAALKSWRAPVIDLLNDNRFFNCNPEDAAKWRSIIKALYDSDKTAFSELLGKISNAPSANIFANKEYEMLLRSLNLRRLSYVILAGDKNQFLTQLPTIQEKLVDIFRSVTSPVVQSEVFICIRVLLCRLSPHNLTSFWPVIFTEMYRIFEQTMTFLPTDGSEDLQLVLSACKCLDLLLVLQTEEFQIHQWVFITDTVDAVYRPNDWFPEAMLDQLSEITRNLPLAATETLNTENSVLQPDRAMRRPLLASLRQIERMRDLVPFFSHISISTYESVYASAGNIDWEAVEKSILDDMFDGR